MLNLLPVQFAAYAPIAPQSAPASPYRGRLVEAQDRFTPLFGAKKSKKTKHDGPKPLVNPKRVKIFTGRAHPGLAAEVAQALGVALSPIELKNHASSETYVQLKESVRDCDVFLVQPTIAPVNETLMELMNMVNAAKLDGARSITAVIPYYGYARQDRRTNNLREANSSRLVADMLHSAGVNQVVLLDLHNQIQEGFFDKSVHVVPLSANKVLAGYLADNMAPDDLANAVIVSPDVNGLPRARAFVDALNHAREGLNLTTAAVDKKRTGHGKAEALALVGDVEGKVAVLFDDMVDTGGTITKAAELIIAKGAKKVFVVATHGVFSDPAPITLAASPFSQVVVTNSIPLRPAMSQTNKVVQVSVGQLLAQAIQELSKRPWK